MHLYMSENIRTTYHGYGEDKSTWSTACFNSTHSRCKAKIKSQRTGVVCTCPCHNQ